MIVSAEAPGKVILCGEHAVVYGQPAIAVPVTQISARATLEETGTGTELTLIAVDQQRTVRYADLDLADPLGVIIRLALLALGETTPPLATLTLSSTIPIASGLGSGAAVSAAIVRVLASYVGRQLPAVAVSELVYQVEKIYHGIPSGIDNTVIAYTQPVYFIRQKVLKTFSAPVPFRLLIADTGLASPTKIAVADVRKGWETDPAKFETLFNRCGEIAQAAYSLIESGHPLELGPLLTANHRLLREMAVSCPELDSLVEAALDAGALGAKLSGGGRGGNMFALVTDETAPSVERALWQAGAKRVITTVIRNP